MGTSNEKIVCMDEFSCSVEKQNLASSSETVSAQTSKKISYDPYTHLHAETNVFFEYVGRYRRNNPGVTGL